MASNNRDWPKKLADRCNDVGWTATIGGSGHYKVTNASGKLLFTFPTTPSSNPHVEKNALKEAERHGLNNLEAATAKLRENERLLRIARDRAQAEEALRLAEPLELASTEVDDDDDAPIFARIDPAYTGPPDSKPRAGYKPRLFRAPSRDVIDGCHVVASQPTTLQNVHGDYQTPQILESLLDDGRTVYQCNSPNERTCTVWAGNPLSIRAHLKTHSTRMIAVRAAVAAERARVALEQELTRRDSLSVANTNPFAKPIPDPTKMELPAYAAHIAGIIEQLSDAFATIIVTTANIQKQFQALIAELDKLKSLEFADAETLDKARKYEQLRTLIQ